MAFVVMTSYIKGNVEFEDTVKPVLYIDSPNRESDPREMMSWCMRYIREHSIINDKNEERKLDSYIVKMVEDIQKMEDGYYMTYDNKKRIITLYRKYTIKGYFYDGTHIDKIFTLKSVEGSKVVPQVLKTTSKFEDFSNELKATVQAYRDRSNITNDNPQIQRLSMKDIFQ